MNKVELIRKIVVYSVYILFLTCFQVSFPDKLSLNGQIADLMFVFVVLVAYMFGLKDGIIIGIIVGVLRDCFAAPAVIGFSGSVVSSVGIGAFTLFAASVFSATVFTIKIKRKPAFALLTLISVTALYKIVGHGTIYIWTRIFSKTIYQLSAKELFVDSIFTQIFLNILAAIPLYLLLRFVGHYKKGQNPMIRAQEGKGADSSWLTI